MNSEKERLERQISKFVKNVDIHVHELRYDICIEFSTIVNGHTFRIFSQSFDVNMIKQVPIENVVDNMILELSKQIFLNK